MLSCQFLCRPCLSVSLCFPPSPPACASQLIVHTCSPSHHHSSRHTHLPTIYFNQAQYLNPGSTHHLRLIVVSAFTVTQAQSSRSPLHSCVIYFSVPIPFFVFSPCSHYFHPSVSSQLASSSSPLLAAPCSTLPPLFASPLLAPRPPASRAFLELLTYGGVISVQEALYGRADSVTCGEGKPQEQLANTECSLEGTMDILKRYVQGVYNHRIIYCFFLIITCILNALIFCICFQLFLLFLPDEGQVISVYGADYRRRDQSTCTYKRPASESQKNDCSRPASTVSDSCDGKNSCIIKASNSVFGGPCPGTFKYLEVAYVCLS
uniref:SUEL-type lectin domain-containing protein n=1 Tax=Sander lucioperca TaxID=283035 RepID=A0A8C9X6N4_SANLU